MTTTFAMPARLASPRSIQLLLICLALAAVAPASAADKTRVLLLQVDGPKNLQADREALLEGLQTKLEAYSNLELVKGPDGDITDQMIDLECIDLDDECLGKLAAKANATRVIHGEAGKKGRVTSLRLRIVEATGASVADQSLEAKDATTLIPLAAASIEAAFGPPPPKVVKGRLMVEASAPTASIFLGPELIGTGTATVTLDAGEYTIRVAHAGSEEVIRRVKVVADDTTVERVTLVPLPVAKLPDDKKTDDEAGAGWVPWVLVGAAVVGGTLAAILLLSGDEEDTIRGPAVLGIDPNSAWRDPATFGGRQ
jgi:hypothetical protein